MKKVVLVIAAALCSVAAGCPHSDTKPHELWPRPAEPRLSGGPDWRPCRTFLRPNHIVEEADCGTPPAAPAECAEIIETHAEAQQMLLRPACTDAAIAALERFALVESAALSDVVAAYVLRAQREDEPADLLRAMDAAESAAAPTSAVLFNRALVQEKLGFPAKAVATWDQYLRKAEPEWEEEARMRRNGAARELARDAAAQWRRNRAKLPLALRKADRHAIAKLIDPFPATAQQYFEEELLPQWASGENLASARIFASALSARFHNDPYAIDAVEAIVQASPEQLRALKDGHLAFREARATERTFNRARAAEMYDKAAELLERGGSPLYLTARLARAVAHSEAIEDAEAWRVFHSIRPRAQKYPHLAARMDATSANFLLWQSHYADSLAAYDAALAVYTRLADHERIATTRARKAGVLGVVGQNDLAWREAFQAVRSLSRLADPQDRHVVLGETSSAARNAGHPGVAFLYQNAIVELFQHEMQQTAPECLGPILRIRQNLSIALRQRADIELDLDRIEPAQRDLLEATRIAVTDTAKDQYDRQRLLARIRAVEGRVLLHTDPVAAANAFTAALQWADVKYRNFRTMLLVERAGAFRRAGRARDAANDLAAALAELRAEESEILARRRRGEHEGVWSAYFSRFREAYDLLVSQHVAERDDRKAFVYAERARAFEPLNLILQLGNVPQEFRELANLPSLDIARLQRQLPAGTFLIEYSVLPERTFVWIISKDAFRRLTLPARRTDVERWTSDLQRAIRDQNTFAILRNVDVPYAALIAEPLTAIETLPHGRGPGRRLVFIPDGAMHSLPFVALRNPITKRYLIQDAIVSTDASALLYVYSLLRDRQFRAEAEPKALLVGNPAFDPQSPLAYGLPFLPGATTEVRRIGEGYASREILIGKDATVAAFLRLARQCSIVHFAGHSMTNAQTPSRSALLFAASNGQSGAIDAEALLKQLTLDQTRLVVLSSCSSAGGLPVGLEGVAPLVRPFRGAGVPAVIGSLWDIPDATAERLLVSFHRHYRAGHDAATALQAAQLELLGSDNAGFRSVLAWAPFQVIGHASSPFAARATKDNEKEKPP